MEDLCSGKPERMLVKKEEDVHEKDLMEVNPVMVMMIGDGDEMVIIVVEEL